MQTIFFVISAFLILLSYVHLSTKAVLLIRGMKHTEGRIFVIALYIGLCPPMLMANLYSTGQLIVIALYIGLCPQQYLSLFFYYSTTFLFKINLIFTQKWVHDFYHIFAKCRFYAVCQTYPQFYDTLLFIDPLFRIP